MPDNVNDTAITTPAPAVAAASPSQGKAGRLLELDALRGIAAFSVVLYHYCNRYEELWGHSPQFSARFPLGRYGVQLFFMISGFVIFMTLSKTTRARDFMVNRFARLYPAYWVAATVTFGLLLLWPLVGHAPKLWHYLANLTMLNYAANPFLPSQWKIEAMDHVYWSLQPELFFYGLILAAWTVNRLRRAELWIAVWLGLKVVCLSLPHSKLLQTGIFLLDLEYADLFAAGMLFYLVRQSGFTKARATLLSVALLSHFVFHGWVEGSLVAVFYACFLALHYGYASLLSTRVLVFLGTISYTLYLVHQNIGYVIIRHGYNLNISAWASVPAAIGVSLLLASLITFLVEKPAYRAIRQAWANRQASGSRAKGFANLFRWVRE